MGAGRKLPDFHLSARALFVLLAMVFSFAASTAWAAGSLIISEFRVRGPNGANDEYVEIYNDSGASHTVTAVSGTGYAVAASDGIARCTIPNGTIIPSRGHYLCVNSVGYSIAPYPAGNGTTATGDATYVTDIADNAGIALFNNNTGGASFSLVNRFDAVGSVAEADSLYKEGTGYATLTPFSINYAFVRDQCGKGASIPTLGPCTISTPKDTDNNAVDFYFVDTNGTSAGAGQRLGTPGPENLSSPITGTAVIPASPLDSTVGNYAPPNVVRDFTSNPANNSTFGTVSIRKRITNNTGANLTRLRFRIVDLSTFPAPSGTADLRPRTSGVVVVAGVNDAVTCAATGVPATPPCTVSVQGTDLEGGEVGEDPNQPNGGGFNSSMSVNSVTVGTPLANGASIDVQFLMGIQQTGNYKIGFLTEGLPVGGDLFMVSCGTDLVCVNPAVVSSVRVDPSPTTSQLLHYTVTFSSAVTGVDVADFALTTTGTVAGASVTNVSGSGTTYTVTVDRGTGAGTLRLDVVDNDSIVDAFLVPLGGAGAGNGGFTAGEVYTITGVPVVSSIVRVEPDPTSAQILHFTVTFSVAVTGVDVTDFALTTTGTIVGASITGVSGSGTTYTVTVDRGTGTGTLRLDLIDNDSIVDGSLTPLGGVGAGNASFVTGEVYTISAAPPAAGVASIPTLGAGPLAALALMLAIFSAMYLRRRPN